MEILTVALATFFTGIGFMIARNGFMAKVTFRQEETPQTHLVYRLHRGDYTQAAAQIKKIEKQLDEAGLSHGAGFGIFMDNPHETEKSTLRSLLGFLVTDTTATLPEGLHYATLPVSDNVVTEFPYKGEFSIAMGALKVYTALGRYRKASGLDEAPVMEIYDKEAGLIRYLVLSGIPASFLDGMAKA